MGITSSKFNKKKGLKRALLIGINYIENTDNKLKLELNISSILFIVIFPIK
jgi:hypothetical protein